MATSPTHRAWREAVRGHRTGALAALAAQDPTVVESFVNEVRGGQAGGRAGQLTLRIRLGGHPQAWQVTALHWAAVYGWVDMAEVLTRDCGANVETRDKVRQTRVAGGRAAEMGRGHRPGPHRCGPQPPTTSWRW